MSYVPSGKDRLQRLFVLLVLRGLCWKSTPRKDLIRKYDSLVSSKFRSASSTNSSQDHSSASTIHCQSQNSRPSSRVSSETITHMYAQKGTRSHTQSVRLWEIEYSEADRGELSDEATTKDLPI